jgi:hypothetical protein
MKPEHVPRLRRADRRRVHGHPVAHRRGIVVDDVEGAGGGGLERGERRGRRVLDVDEGEDAAARARDRDAAALRVGVEAPVRRVGRARPVEVPVSQHDAVRQRADLRLERAHRSEHAFQVARRRLIERIALDAQRRSRLVGEGDALRDEAAHALHGGGGAGSKWRVPAVRTRFVAARSRATARVDARRDRINSWTMASGAAAATGARAPCVERPHHRLRARGAQRIDLRRRPCDDHRVARLF